MSLLVDTSYSSPTQTLVDVMRAFCPGITQGATTVLLGHPLDTTKTRMQAVGPHVQRSMWRTLFLIGQQEGLRGLYRGAAPPILMEGAKRGVQFALWDIFQRNAKEAPKGGRVKERESFSWRGVGRSLLGTVGSSTFLSGAAAGGVGTLIGCPMHVIKIQTQNQTAKSTRNAWTCTMDIWRRERLKGFYRGFKANLIKDVFFCGTYLSLYAYFKKKVKRVGVFSTHPSIFPSDGLHVLPFLYASSVLSALQSEPLQAFLAGSAACMLTWMLLYPLDTLKTQIQSRKLASISSLNGSDIHFREVYRGLCASLWRAGPIAGIAMIVYESVKEKVAKKD